MLNLNTPRHGKLFSLLALLCLLALISSVSLVAQTTLSTGSITGIVTDPSSAVVGGAKVSITNTATGQTVALTTNAAGAFSSGPLPPGTYKVQVSAKGFSSTSSTLGVQVGNEATFNAKLQVGQESQVVEVQGSTIQVNTEQATVQGVLTSEQVENLPVNGRNFLDLAQLEPGVQIQDGQNFDPTKAGYSSISFGGRFGRTARVDVDGVDISDETVGTTTSNVPASAIDEFQISQSSLDLSQDLTSSGAVNVTTKSGTNTLHGEAFGYIRDHSFAANAPGGHDYPFQRQQYGGKVGGPIIKNKLFFFLDGERTKQDAFAAVDLSGTPYPSGGFSQPFRENNLLAKADYTFGNGAKAFYRYSYFKNSLDATFGLGYSVYDNKDITRNHVVGLDFTKGNFTHSFRFSYLKFQNQIVDATLTNSSLPLCCTGLEISSGGLFVGPNLLAPQSTPQSDRQIKYDGTKIFHSHTLRYGVSFNHIQGGGFADFYGTAPRVSYTTNTAAIAAAALGPFPALKAGDDPSDNPLNYPVTRLRVGNGQGFNTLQPALGFPAGGLGPDNRLGLYVGDSWKVKPNLTVNWGLRYDRDTGRTDSDLPADASINAVFPGYGNRVQQANKNFAPQIGVAWDPKGNGKTVIRAGGGLFYENVIYNNVLFDRPFRLKTGAFNAVTSACNGAAPFGVAVSTNFDPSGFIFPSQYDPVTDPTGICGNPFLGNVIPQILSFWDQVKTGNPLDLQADNPNYIGNFLGAGIGVPGPALFAPNYKSPVSVQMNVGIQHEIKPGLVFSADYLRNVETRTLLGIDINKVGDVSTFSLAGAQSAISATNNAFGCGTGFDSASVDCAIAAGAQITDYAGNGLGTPNDASGVGCGQPTSGGGFGIPCAFGGLNSLQNQAFFLKPIGRSVYNALQMKLVHNVSKPFRGVKALNYQLAYSFSNISNSGGAPLTGTPADSDQDFVLSTPDNNNPGRYYGPALLDRTHQISAGGYFDIPAGFRVSLIAHFDSPLASGIISPNSGAQGEIYRTDFTGDGTVGDPLPGTHFGQFDRGTNASQLTALIGKYDTATAGQATPAGQTLIANGLMSLSQLQSLGGVAPYICLPVNDSNPNCGTPSPQETGGQVNYGWLKTTDLKFSWHHTFAERFTVEPNIGIYNLFNFANFNLPPATMSGILNGLGSGAINGTTRFDQNAFRVGNGTGVYSLGSYRQIEFGLRLVF